MKLEKLTDFMGAVVEGMGILVLAAFASVTGSSSSTGRSGKSRRCSRTDFRGTPPRGYHDDAVREGAKLAGIADDRKRQTEKPE